MKKKRLKQRHTCRGATPSVSNRGLRSPSVSAAGDRVRETPWSGRKIKNN